MRKIAVILLLATLSQACAGGYLPRPTRHARLVQDYSGPAVYKDGIRYEVGFFGDGLTLALADNAHAHAYAQQYYDDNRNGMLLYVLGLVGIVASPAVALGGNNGRGVSDSQIGTMLGVMGAGLAASVIGIVYLAQAPRRMHDAINVYNDDIDAPLAEQRQQSREPEPVPFERQPQVPTPR